MDDGDDRGGCLPPAMRTLALALGSNSALLDSLLSSAKQNCITRAIFPVSSNTNPSMVDALHGYLHQAR